MEEASSDPLKSKYNINSFQDKILSVKPFFQFELVPTLSVILLVDQNIILYNYRNSLNKLVPVTVAVSAIPKELFS